MLRQPVPPRPAPRRPAASAAALGHAALLVDQCLQAVREVARQRREQAGELRDRRLQGAGELGQHGLAGRQVGERGDVAGG